MRIDVTKSVFTSSEIEFILDQLKKAAKKGFLIKRRENNLYLQASYKGVEAQGISPKWNIKIYRYSDRANGHSLVCVDKQVLASLLNEAYDHFIPPDLPVLRIDDAGWGFPLCGVMVGIADEESVLTDVVPVEYFRADTRYHFQTKRYLKVYADLALRLLDQFNATPSTHRIEICTGYVNQPLREKLRKLGYDVRVVEIKGLLQHRLEHLYQEHVHREIGVDLYYDPKAMDPAKIPEQYRRCLEFGRRQCPEKIKTGWSALNGRSNRRPRLRQER